MDSIYSIVHITTEKKYKKIMEDGYIRPVSSVQLENQRFSNLRDKKLFEFLSFHGTGVFCMIQKKKDNWKNTILRLSGTSVIELDKKILLERSDYIIRNSIIDGYEEFSGKIIYNAKNDKDKKKLNKAISRLTNLNEIMFERKISLKKYMMSAFTKKIQQFGGVWGKNEDDILSKWISIQKFIKTDIGIVIFNDPSIGRSSNSKIFIGTLKTSNKSLDISVKLQKNNRDAEDEANISMELSRLPGIPQYFAYGLTGPPPKLYYIIMQRLGSTFGSSEKTNVGATFELDKLKILIGNYSIQLLNGIESLYMHHYYHLDITTSNILFGVEQNSNILYLIDFCNISETKKEYETDINNFNRNCNNNLYNAMSDIIINYGINQYKKFFEYSITIIKSTIDFIIKSILSNDTEPPNFQALRNMFSNFAKDLILPLRPDNNIFQLAIEHKIINDKIIPFLLQEI